MAFHGELLPYVTKLAR